MASISPKCKAVIGIVEEDDKVDEKIKILHVNIE